MALNIQEGFVLRMIAAQMVLILDQLVASAIQSQQEVIGIAVHIGCRAICVGDGISRDAAGDLSGMDVPLVGKFPATPAPHVLKWLGFTVTVLLARSMLTMGCATHALLSADQ